MPQGGQNMRSDHIVDDHAGAVDVFELMRPHPGRQADEGRQQLRAERAYWFAADLMRNPDRGGAELFRNSGGNLKMQQSPD
jgi:hypothetical protein